MQNESGIIPIEFNVVIKMDPVTNKIGSLYIPDTKKERDELAADEGTLIAVSPLAFDYSDWPEGSRRPQIGDRILFATFEGRLWKPQGEGGPVYRIVKDKSIVAVIEPKPALAVAA